MDTLTLLKLIFSMVNQLSSNYSNPYLIGLVLLFCLYALVFPPLLKMIMEKWNKNNLS